MQHTECYQIQNDGMRTITGLSLGTTCTKPHSSCHAWFPEFNRVAKLSAFRKEKADIVGQTTLEHQEAGE